MLRWAGHSRALRFTLTMILAVLATNTGGVLRSTFVLRGPDPTSVIVVNQPTVLDVIAALGVPLSVAIAIMSLVVAIRANRREREQAERLLQQEHTYRLREEKAARRELAQRALPLFRAARDGRISIEFGDEWSDLLDEAPDEAAWSLITQALHEQIALYEEFKHAPAKYDEAAANLMLAIRHELRHWVDTGQPSSAPYAHSEYWTPPPRPECGNEF